MSDINDIFEKPATSDGGEDQWISLSDLMTSLMLIFMLIAIAFMLKTEQDTFTLRVYSEQMKKDAEKMQKDAEKMQDTAEKVKQIAVVYNQVKNDLYEDLSREFKDDFPRWGAALDKNLSIRFDNEFILFNRGKDEVKLGFQGILQNFFPRYLRIITSEKYRNTIQEVRIEGHTSSIWGGEVSPQEAYFKNMELSQARTRSVLHYILMLPQVQVESPWLRQFVTANGLSSSRPVLNADGTENEVLSQRVEFRIRTDAESKITNILQASAPAP